jgi:hypothetical protein
MLGRFRSRDLFVRCLEISRRTVKNWEGYGRQNLIDLGKIPHGVTGIEADIHKRLPANVRGHVNKFDVRLSIPGAAGVKTAQALIQASKEGDPENIAEYFPLDQWTDSYANNKWRSYAYAPREIAKDVRDATAGVLKENLGLDIDVAKSDKSCHLV